VDPFAGGGAIPLEALRMGADAFASDLNPVAVLLNKVVLEYIPKFGNARIETKDAEGNPIAFNGLAEAVQYWGMWIKEQAEKELIQFYPSNVQTPSAYSPQIVQTRKINGDKWEFVSIAEEKPIAYLFARTIFCEGPSCGAQVPLLRSLWLAKKRDRSIALQIIPNQQTKRVEFQIIEKLDSKWHQQSNLEEIIQKPDFEGTVRRGSVTCPVCGYTTPVEKIREQLKKRKGGANEAQLYAIANTLNVIRKNGFGEVRSFEESGRFYRLPNEIDNNALRTAVSELERIKKNHSSELGLVPDEPTPDNHGHRAVGSAWVYGMTQWGQLFTSRQLLSLITIVKKIRTIQTITRSNPFFEATQVILSLTLDKQADLGNSLNRWEPVAQCPRQLFARQAIPMVWDFAESVPIGKSSGSFSVLVDNICDSLLKLGSNWNIGHIEQSSALEHPLPDDIAQCFFTDPPYYDSVSYADLSDFFYVWLRRSLNDHFSDLFKDDLTPKNEQAIVWHPDSEFEKKEFEVKMTQSLSEGRRYLIPKGIGIVVFAHKSTSGWEAQLKSMLDAGWIITGSWPVDTEMGSRVNAAGTASLASSIHLVCRPRETSGGDLVGEIGDWRDVLNELPERIHSWLPRLANEGIVGADAIFACLGPALEIFSRYSHVEKASGEVVTLKEYLEVVWAAVSREAMSVIFEGADASGFEEDARLTAMWLWTLSGNKPENQPNGNDNKETEEADEETSTKTNGSGSHYMLEYDTARKIAQGLGAHLERLNSLVELTGDQARLLSVSERAGSLFGREENPMTNARKKAASSQLSLFSLMVSTDGNSAEDEWQEDHFQVGQTTLDQIHQAMLLFGAGRNTALKLFLVDDGIGKAERFWRLAQALSALYPSSSEEKRWIDGVLAKKKGLGF
jgi:adenine-specific DNA methylase